jgi:TorA maturation chaperone TorD
MSANENRKVIYTFLARTFATEVTVDYLRELLDKKDPFMASAQDPEIIGTQLAAGFKELAEFASSLKQNDLEKTRLELAVEYAGLFLGVWHVPAHPSESAYYTQGQLIMQQPRDEVLKLYRSMGVDKALQFREPEDHIALELQFMLHLCDKTNEALKRNDFPEAGRRLEIQRDFLDDHLSKWVPKLCSDILKSAKREFYKAIAKITEGYIEMDKATIVDLINSLASSSKSPK